MKQILVKDHCISTNHCDQIIAWFENNKDSQQPGQVGSERTDQTAKVSVDIPRWFQLQERPEQILEKGLTAGGTQYQKEQYREQ